jgi:hypothetical protein
MVSEKQYTIYDDLVYWLRFINDGWGHRLPFKEVQLIYTSDNRQVTKIKFINVIMYKVQD